MDEVEHEADIGTDADTWTRTADAMPPMHSAPGCPWRWSGMLVFRVNGLQADRRKIHRGAVHEEDGLPVFIRDRDGRAFGIEEVTHWRADTNVRPDRDTSNRSNDNE